ncbi:Ldh family oxidoreductase [Gluconacetobacter azotocaptans]|uniref:Ldh family oxidoreductase n=1 Tax=Gluconacetobacter azotocaptans TaxID=142834 RepID=UPI00195F0A4A|nr:Ldh family oxidoreductase [Gluconacetobacter azotocaptans]MBM9403793.1 Ldh family oxidoreductase [Gluconacetobacter azotocaptans]
MTETMTVDAGVLAARVTAALRAAGASAESAAATTEALMYASRIGVDSHGVRLAAHYAAMLRQGRLNPIPVLTTRRTAAATAVLDADDGPGHFACYRAMELAVGIAAESGLGAVGIVRSSHCGAAGAYALKAAEAGMIGIVTSNSDANVALFEGAVPFHGTNPIAMAAPVAGQQPWLLDLATSSIPFNRVRLYRSLNRPLPAGVAADAQGRPTTDAHAAEMLLPLGGPDYGFKGAGLAGMVTILSAVLTGATTDPHMIPMTETDDRSTARNVGQFCLAIDPARFVGRAAYEAAMADYLGLLRQVPSTGDSRPVMAPGDREWETARHRARDGIPIDPDTRRFLGL